MRCGVPHSPEGHGTARPENELPKPRAALFASSPPTTAGFTALELCITLALGGLLVVVAIARLQDMRQGHAKNPVQCQENLKFIGVALQDFAADHDDRFPWEVPRAQGGSQEAAATGQAAPHFRALTNTIRNTRTLLCPMDPVRYQGATLGNLDDSAISYFLNISARKGSKNAILAGDRTVSPTEDSTTGEIGVNGGSILRWTHPSPDEPGHQDVATREPTGNLILNNGTLMETSSSQLQRLVRSLGTNTHRLILP